MSEPISYTGIAVSLALPWLLGGVWIYWLAGRTGRWNLPLVLGQGYLAGMLTVVLLLRLWQATGLDLQFWSIAAVAALLTITGCLLILARPIAGQGPIIAKTPTPAWQRVLIIILLALMGWRCLTVLQEILLRPLYPWDAWMNWAPKAIVWYHYLQFVPFVSPESWLSAPAGELNYTEGAGSAWKYPVAIPMIQLWGMLGAGSSSETLIYLPWFFITIAAGLALYGHLRLQGISTWACTAAAYLLLSTPLLNIHTALAGYADLWLAAVFGCAVFALKEWDVHRNWQFALLALLLALFCTQLKIPGLVMGGIIVLAFLISLLRLQIRHWLTLLAIIALVIPSVFLVGIDVHIPQIGRLAIDTEKIIVPYMGVFNITYHPIHGAMVRTLLLMSSWNLLWFYSILAGALLIFRRRQLRFMRMELLAVTGALIFIFSVYYFTGRYRFALDYTQVNRALLYVVPGLVFCLFNLIYSGKSARFAAQDQVPNSTT